jgi:hypothetical protein
MLSEAAYNTEVPLYPCAAEAVRIYRYQYRGAKNDDEGSGPFAGLNDDAAMLIRFLRGKEKAAQFFCGTSVFGKWSGRAAELRTETGGSAVLGDIPEWRESIAITHQAATAAPWQAAVVLFGLCGRRT